jgi:hypothetical protein
MRFCAVLLVLAGVASVASPARAHKNSWRGSSKSISPPADPAYAAALAAANRFLHAWQTQDHETGILMLTDAARAHASRERLQEFFSPSPDAAFEIQRGKHVNGEYVFPVVLFGLSETDAHAHPGSVVITNMGKGDWAVDKLP